MRTVFALVFCFTTLQSFSQFVINTQADIDAFCGMSSIPTNILLQPSCPVPIDLAPMNPCISMITSMTIQGNCITDLSALNGIVSLNQLSIGNTKLTNLSGLDNLTEIPSSPRKLTIKDNTCLDDISALANNLFATPCSAGGGEPLGELVLINNDLLDDSDMDVFDNTVCGIGTSLRIEDMDGIQCLDQFNNLVNIPFLSIIDNDNLLKVDFCALTDINHPSIMSAIKNNPQLEDVNSFKNLCSINVGLSICDNTGILMDGCDELCNALEEPGCDISNVTFVNNGGDCFGNCAAILPVELSEWSATHRDGFIVLNWITLNEVNNDYFQIEHSINGSDFLEIGRVNGNGNSNELNNYEMIHHEPSVRLNYYRLKQMDFDGAYEYSAIIQIRLEGEREITLYPNPVVDALTVSFGEEPAKATSIEIYSLAGKLLIEQNISVDGNEARVDLGTLTNGQYVLRLNNNNESITRRFVKAN